MLAQCVLQAGNGIEISGPGANQFHAALGHGVQWLQVTQSVHVSDAKAKPAHRLASGRIIGKERDEVCVPVVGNPLLGQCCIQVLANAAGVCAHCCVGPLRTERPSALRPLEALCSHIPDELAATECDEGRTVLDQWT